MTALLELLRTWLVLLAFFACFLGIALPLVWYADRRERRDRFVITVRERVRR